jgi:hypothetical protein
MFFLSSIPRTPAEDAEYTALKTGHERAVASAQLRARAVVCRAAARIPTDGGHETDRLLREIAGRLEREADELEADERP